MTSILVFITLLLSISSTSLSAYESTLGNVCSDVTDCIRYYTYTDTMACTKGGSCVCRPGLEPKYDPKSMEPECGYFYVYALKYMCSSRRKCGPNSTCKSSNDSTQPTLNTCYCNDGFLRVGDECRRANHQPLFAKCGRDYFNNVLSCDLELHSICSGGQCVCFYGYFGNTTSGRCERMDKYVRTFNLTEYRVKPGEYCRRESHCIAGLECRDLKCACPSPCIYNKTEEICDCGTYEIEKPDTSGPIGVGIFVGILIAGFWYCKIKGTIKKFKKKRAAEFTVLSDVAEQMSPSHNAYALSPVSEDTTTEGASGPPIGLTVPSPKPDGRESPVSSSSQLDKTQMYSSGPPPPSPTQYNINPTLISPSYPIAPPPYSETPCATDLPPPYSLNAPTDASLISPYSNNPSQDRYPSAPPFSIN